MKNAEDINMETIIQNLKSKDAELIKKNRLMLLLGIIIIAGWVFAKINSGDMLIGLDSLMEFLVVATFSVILAYRYYFSRLVKKVNYADSVKNLLSSAEKRYRFWSSKLIIETIGAIFVSFVVGLMIFKTQSGEWEKVKLIAASIVIPVVILTFSIFRSYSMWKKGNRPLWESTKELLKEFEE